MKVLVVGGGGREHALVWKLKQSPRVREIICAPGNAGIAALARCVGVDASDVEGLLKLALEEKVDLTVVGPEVALTLGLADRLEALGLRVFGPVAGAARLEGSKIFSKEIMTSCGVPTARYASFSDPVKACDYIRELNSPCVVKADGLAAGKGVIMASTPGEALEAVSLIMEENAFGSAGSEILIEELLVGEEVSILAFTDGETVVPMLPAQDHKRIFDGDQGPNTGGMGAYAPAPVATAEIRAAALDRVLLPVVKGMAARGIPYKGVLYAGLMVTEDGIRVLEFNARFGDPEAQPVLTLLKTDLVEIMEAVIDGKLKDIDIKWQKGAAVCVVASAGGYPGSYRKGEVISGLDSVPPGVTVFHAGTALQGDEVVTAGGRVLGITATGSDIVSAIDKVYQGVEKIGFKDMHYRKDIARRALAKV